MSFYRPSPNASPNPPWDVAELAQRDASYEIPMNYKSFPGVSLRAACFAENLYEDEATVLCLSNLLSMGWRRLVIDLYWDAGRQVWSLCPAAISEMASSQDDTSIPSAPSSTSALQLLSETLTDGEAQLARATGSHFGLDHLNPRQDNQSLSTTAGPAVTGPVDAVESPLLEIGPFKCTATATLSLLTNVLLEYFQSTDTDVQVDFSLLELNIHAAASSTSPTSPAEAPTESELPRDNNLITGVLTSNLASFIYTPRDLESGRVNLNSSFLRVPGPDGPITPYYQIEVNDDGNYGTPDGWPTETYTDFVDYHRMLVAFGSVDPQMSAYNFTGDERTIFSPQEVSNIQVVTYGSNGNLESGCFFDKDTPRLTDATNNSWALTPQLVLPETGELSNNTFDSLGNLTSCGISAFLNETLSGQTADSSPEIYRTFVNYATIWSWAPGEPFNVSLTQDDVRDGTDGRCAAIVPAASGRWRAVDCAKRHRAACRIGDQPYLWTLTEDSSTFSDVAGRCPQNSSFSLPRTGLENSYLLATINEVYAQERRADLSTPVFLNFQSLDIDSCWVVGVDQRCPYSDHSDRENNRRVTIPAVGAVVVFTVALLMFFTKCASNRTKALKGRRRKGGDRGDYEGVPS